MDFGAENGTDANDLSGKFGCATCGSRPENIPVMADTVGSVRITLIEGVRTFGAAFEISLCDLIGFNKTALPPLRSPCWTWSGGLPSIDIE